jgi:hypothetical protein
MPGKVIGVKVLRDRKPVVYLYSISFDHGMKEDNIAVSDIRYPKSNYASSNPTTKVCGTVSKERYSS